jgi:hypothetical protein
VSEAPQWSTARADQVASWARDTFHDFVDNAIRLTPPRVLLDPSAPGFLAMMYKSVPAHELAALLSYAIVSEVKRRGPLGAEDCRAGLCQHVNCPDRP